MAKISATFKILKDKEWWSPIGTSEQSRDHGGLQWTTQVNQAAISIAATVPDVIYLLEHINTVLAIRYVITELTNVFFFLIRKKKRIEDVPIHRDK